MASPQLEDGYTRFANELMEALMRTNLSAYQSRVLWAIWRNTYGYHKKQDWLSNSQLVGMTGIRKQHISRAVRELIQRNIVTKSGYSIAFNKDYTQWRELPKRVTLPKLVTKVTATGDNRNPYRGTQKKKEKNLYNFPSFEKNSSVGIIVEHYSRVFKELTQCRPNFTKSDIVTLSKALKEMTVDEAKNLIEFAVDLYFRDKPEGKGMRGTLKTCFSPYMLQEYNVEWQKRKWRICDAERPITTDRWWR